MSRWFIAGCVHPIICRGKYWRCISRADSLVCKVPPHILNNACPDLPCTLFPEP